MWNPVLSLAPKPPKFIGPATHAVLDYATATTFFIMAAYFRKRHGRAAALALLNGATVLMASLLTDYPGGVWPTISFKTHGKLDGMQAALAGSGPALFGFRHEPQARFFYTQAGIEAQVIAATDWERENARSPVETA